MNNRYLSGFTLLEAIVAITLVASSGMALFSWINSNLMSLQHVQESNARAEAMNNAIEYLDAINPMQTPSGSVDMGHYHVRWEAVLRAPLRDGVNFPIGLSLWQFGLYDVSVKIGRLNDEQWFAFETKLVGYQRVRSIQIE